LEGLGAKYLRQRWVEDGKFLTTAGVSAGIDGGLYLASRLVGEDAAKLIQRGIEYEPEPPLGPIDWDPRHDALRPIWRPAHRCARRTPRLSCDARLEGCVVSERSHAADADGMQRWLGAGVPDDPTPPRRRGRGL
jgi:hypothetical protein